MHRFFRPATFVLVHVLVLLGCKPTAPPGTTNGAPETTPTAVAAPAATQTVCPDADFATFLKRFEGNADVQRASTAEVVTMDSIDADALPEPKPVTKQVPRAELNFPVLLGPAQRQAEGLQETVSELGPVEREVMHGIPDSDAQVRFNFQATPCWTLVRISDDTI